MLGRDSEKEGVLGSFSDLGRLEGIKGFGQCFRRREIGRR